MPVSTNSPAPIETRPLFRREFADNLQRALALTWSFIRRRHVLATRVSRGNDTVRLGVTLVAPPGLEPGHHCWLGILSPLRLPFRQGAAEAWVLAGSAQRSEQVAFGAVFFCTRGRPARATCENAAGGEHSRFDRGVGAAEPASMRVLFSSLRERSHFMPLIPFIAALRRAGHEVGVAAPSDMSQSVAATGAEFFAVGHPGDEGLRPTWMKLREVPEDEKVRVAIAELFAGVCARAALPSMIEILERWQPAALVRESLEFAGVLAAQKVGLPHARVAIMAPGAEAMARAVANPMLDEHRRGLDLSLDPQGERLRSEAALTLFPPSFEEFEPHPAQTRAYRLARPRAPLLGDWWPGRTGPFVYATLGTVTGKVDVVHSAYRRLLDAFADVQCRVLLTIGADLPLEALGEVPSHVRVERFVPQDDVLPHAAAVVCHGGSGTVQGALAAGCPLIVTPLFADQPHNASRVEAIGAGIRIGSNEGPAALGAALCRVLAEPGFRLAAERVASDVATLPLVDEASTYLESIAAGNRGSGPSAVVVP